MRKLWNLLGKILHGIGTRDLQMPTNFAEARLYDRWQEGLSAEAKEEDDVERVRRQLRE